MRLFLGDILMIDLEKIGIDYNKSQIITIVGAGGKTSIMFDMGKKLKLQNRKVLITTTTKIYIPDKRHSDEMLLGKKELFDSYKPPKGSVTTSGKKVVQGNKYKGYNIEEIDYIRNKNIFDYIIIEGDGAKKRPLKAPRNFEPLVPKNTDILLGVIGMDVLNKYINSENIFALKEFLDITDKMINERIDADCLIDLIVNKNGLFKYRGNENYLILNKINPENIKAAKKIKLEMDRNYSNFIKGTILVEEIV